jgi:hypothetical protein
LNLAKKEWNGKEERRETEHVDENRRNLGN